ncbi:MAG: sensor histidine kinase, partial [Dehalococcoidia bacterium]|nr:sensor histidine kinase [Dehalococcoidia bacterium]
LTAIKMDLSWLSQHIGAVPPEEAGERISNMIALTDTSVRTVQSVSSRLRPGILDDLGLVAALEWLARDFQQRGAIHCSTKVDTSIDIVGHKATVLFRICQESLTNVARHSGASEVTVTLSRRNTEVVLSVQDNGRGITTEEMENPRSYGVMGMRERAMAIGGTVTISGAPDKGTVVEATLPDA